MNSKTFEHIDKFVDGLKWIISISTENGQIDFDLNLPNADHLPSDKKNDLNLILQIFIEEHIDRMYLDPVYVKFRRSRIDNKICAKIKAFIKLKEDQRVSLGLRSIKEELRKRIIFGPPIPHAPYTSQQQT